MRSSDRWITPGVITAAIITGGLVVAVVAGCVAWLAAQGIDPDPMLRLVAQVVAAVGSLGTLLLQLFGRTTVAKVERNTGVLASNVADLVSAPAPAPAAAVPAPAPAADDLDDYVRQLHGDDGPDPRYVPVPPIPAYPRHRRTAQ